MQQCDPAIALKFSVADTRIRVSAVVKPIQTTVGSRRPYVIGNGLGQRAKTGFAVAQFALCLATLGHVLNDPDKADRPAGLIELEFGAGGYHPLLAIVAAANTVFDIQWRRSASPGFRVRRDLLIVIDHQRLDHRDRDSVGALDPIDIAKFLGGAKDVGLDVEREYTDATSLLRAAEASLSLSQRFDCQMPVRLSRFRIIAMTSSPFTEGREP
jgi:hypothetical protein